MELVATIPGCIQLNCILTSFTLSEWRKHTIGGGMILRPGSLRIGSKGNPGSPVCKMRRLGKTRSPLAPVFKATDASVIFGPGVIS